MALQQEATKPSDEILEALGSVGRLKIVAALGKHPERWFAFYYILKETSMNKRLIKQNLAALISCGWVQSPDPSVGARKYRLNLSNSNVESFLEFLKKSDYYSEAL